MTVYSDDYSDEPSSNGYEDSDEPSSNGYEDSDEPSSNGYEDSDEPISNGYEDSDEPISNGYEDDSDEPISNGYEDDSDEPISNGYEDNSNEPISNGYKDSYEPSTKGYEYSYEPSSDGYRIQYDDGGSYKREDLHTPYYYEQSRSNQTGVREWTSRIKNENKKSGGYERVTVKEKMSRGETHIERSTGRYGIADEHKKSSTVKIGDKSRYTEYSHEDKVRRVNYDGKNSSRLNQGSKNTSLGVNHYGSGGIKKSSSMSVNHGKNKSTTVSINYGNKKSSSGGKHMTK